MSIQKYLEEMKDLQKNILDYFENEDLSDSHFQKLILFFDELKIGENQYKLMSLLHLVSKISNNFHNGTKNINKIEQIINFFKKEIKKDFLNSEIINIFKSNKRILLFLIEEQIIFVDNYFIKKIITDKYRMAKYPQYFLPEIKPFINTNLFPKYDPDNYLTIQNKWVLELNEEIPQNFFELRKEGENDTFLCQLIRKDLNEEFIIQIHQINCPFKIQFESSIYETNSFLIKKKTTSLIEYAAFFGSVKIFKYLLMNGCELTSSLWSYAIHGKNAEIIHLLEEKSIITENETYQKLLIESIKCHHNDLAQYIESNYLQNSQDLLVQSLKYYNFDFMRFDQINQSLFVEYCKFDYFYLVDSFINDESIDINMEKIF